MKSWRTLFIGPVVLALIGILAFVATSATAQPTQNYGNLVTFQGGIGVQPLSAGAGTDTTATTVVRNIVRDVQPAVQPWRIAGLQAEVQADGHISVLGEGLVFAGGDTVGTALLNTASGGTTGFTVFATLICQNVAPFVESDSPSVTLSPNGNFEIDGVLSPLPPASCATPVLLIRNTANLNWFAAGIPTLGQPFPW
jgi:hypothetical protein